jgi:hypothetical protein
MGGQRNPSAAKAEFQETLYGTPEGVPLQSKVGYPKQSGFSRRQNVLHL